MPTSTSGIPQRARAVATTKSQAMVISKPPPTANPSTAATVTLSSSSSALAIVWYRRARRMTPLASPHLYISVMSSPAQNVSPAPWITSTFRLVEDWTRSIAPMSSSLSAIDSAFRFSGRSSVIRATGPCSV